MSETLKAKEEERGGAGWREGVCPWLVVFSWAGQSFKWALRLYVTTGAEPEQPVQAEA